MNYIDNFSTFFKAQLVIEYLLVNHLLVMGNIN